MAERFYGYAQQAREYRDAARDLGCRCPDSLPPFVHLMDCDLYESADAMAARLEDEHAEDAR